MRKYYKLSREQDLLPALHGKLWNDRDWQDQLEKHIPCHAYTLTKGTGDQKKNVHVSDLPELFLLREENFGFGGLGPLLATVGPMALVASGVVVAGLLKNLHKTSSQNYQHTAVPQKLTSKEGRATFVVCNLSKVSPEAREHILAALGVVIPTVCDDKRNMAQMLADFYNYKDSIFFVAPQYILKHFPLTYAEEMIYDSIFSEHPLVGYEHMLVPLENYYKFLSEQSFNEFLTILVRLGVKKVELVHSENKLMKNALDAYVGYQKVAGVSGGYTSVSAESNHLYWGMEFQGRQVSPDEISDNFLDNFPFHRNNGTLKAMIQGIRSGNRNRTYTVERSFTGNYGLDVNSAIKVLGLKAGFDFNKEMYIDEKSTFSVLY